MFLTGILAELKPSADDHAPLGNRYQQKALLTHTKHFSSLKTLLLTC